MVVVEISWTNHVNPSWTVVLPGYPVRTLSPLKLQVQDRCPIILCIIYRHHLNSILGVL